jgi:ribosomal protein L12E/L44/L45/RPP1/RPP2
MKYLAAYLLANLAGTEQPSAKDVKKILSSVGAEVDAAQLDKLISSLEGKDVNEVCSLFYDDDFIEKIMIIITTSSLMIIS